MSGPTAPVIRSSDLPVRAASGVAAIVVAVVCLGLGGRPFVLLLSAAALLMAAEWGGLMRAATWRITLLVVGVGAVMAPLLPDIGAPPDLQLKIAAAVTLAVMLIGASVRLGLGVLYASLPVLALMAIRREADGIVLTLWTLAVVWATDIGAYFAGRAIGGPKLAPRLSPNKTWAGLIGGMTAALAVAFLIAWTTSVPWRLASLAGLLAAAAQTGDLFESWLKRRAGVKDSGRLLPGHGGAMDRLDGVVPVAIIVALLLYGDFV